MPVYDEDLGYAATLKTLKRMGTKRKKGAARVHVGWWDKKQAVKAIVNEHGSPARNIPSRPFIENALVGNEQEIFDMVQEVVEDTLDEGASGAVIDPNMAMGFVGHRVRRMIQQSARDLRTPPNKASTLSQKEGSNPLVDDGQMVAFIEVKVE